MTLTKSGENIIITGPNVSSYVSWNDFQTTTTVYGGGIVSWDSPSSSIMWSSRIIALPAAASSDQYFEIVMPSSGSHVTYYKEDNSITAVTVSSTGFQLLNYECLVYYFILFFPQIARPIHRAPHRLLS